MRLLCRRDERIEPGVRLVHGPRILFCINSLDPIVCVLCSGNGGLVNTLKTTAVWFQCAWGRRVTRSLRVKGAFGAISRFTQMRHLIGAHTTGVYSLLYKPPHGFYHVLY